MPDNTIRFSENDYVSCGSNGICRIISVSPLKNDPFKNDRVYYHLQPVYESGVMIYRPVDQTTGHLRPPVTKDRAKTLLQEIPDVEVMDIQNEKMAENLYKTELREEDCDAVIRVLKTAYMRMQARLQNHKKSIHADEKFYQIAMNLLSGEFSIVFGLSKEETARKLCDQLEKCGCPVEAAI